MLIGCSPDFPDTEGIHIYYYKLLKYNTHTLKS